MTLQQSTVHGVSFLFYSELMFVSQCLTYILTVASSFQLKNSVWICRAMFTYLDLSGDFPSSPSSLYHTKKKEDRKRNPSGSQYLYPKLFISSHQCKIYLAHRLKSAWIVLEWITYKYVSDGRLPLILSSVSMITKLGFD